MDAQKRRAWAEVDLERITCNYRALRGLLAPGCRMMAPVKADAYGHGAVAVAKTLEHLGADYFAVAYLDEGVELRRAGIVAPILVLGLTDPTDIPLLLEHNLIQTVGGLTYGRALSAAAEAAAGTLTIHLKADTGMSRLGVPTGGRLAAAADELAAIAALPGLKAEGIYTHFASADCSEDYTMAQFTLFLDLVAELEKRGITGLIRHCAASAAVLQYPCTHLDMVRPGISLYGCYPGPGMEVLCPLRPALSLYARVLDVRPLPAGTAVSYGNTHVLTRDSRLATLAVGYGDGLLRSLSDKHVVDTGYGPAPLLGRVCMDLCVVDATDLPQLRPGDTAVVYGDGAPVETAAQRAGTICYELLCAISRRVPRLYR